MLVGFLFYPEAACWLVLWLSYGIVYCYQKQHVYRLYINANRFLAWSNTLANLAIPARCTSTGSRLLWLRRFFSGKPTRTHVKHNGYFFLSMQRYIFRCIYTVDVFLLWSVPYFDSGTRHHHVQSLTLVTVIVPTTELIIVVFLLSIACNPFSSYCDE